MACLILETVTQSYLTTKVSHGIKRKSLYVKKQKKPVTTTDLKKYFIIWVVSL